MRTHLPIDPGLLFGLCVALGAADGVPHAVADVHPLRVVSQVCDTESCRRAMAYGSAVSLGRGQAGRELFLTAAHCLPATAARIEIGIHGQWHLATAIARAEDHADIALLGVTFAGQPLTAARIARTPADLGTQVALTGFPEGGAFRKRMGTVIPHRFREFDLVINQPSLPGESGGGIFNADGELAGIISATAPANAPTQTLAIGISQIRKLLDQTLSSPACRPPHPPAPNDSAKIAELERELKELRSRLVALESQSAQPAAMNPALVRRVERLEQLEIPVQILSPEGRILDESRYPLGQPIQLRLIPKRE